MIFLFRRVLCKFARSCYFSELKKYSKAFVDTPSALYVGIDYRGTGFCALDPYVDIDGSFKNLDKMKSDLEKRNMCIDVDYLYEQSFMYSKVSDLMQAVHNEIDGMYLELRNAVKKEVSDLEDKTTYLKTKISEAREKLQVAKEEFIHLEQNFVIPFLNLPNSLHKNTNTHDEVLFSFFPVPEFLFKPKSHVEIGLSREELDFRGVSPTSFYLSDNLAVLELAISDYILSQFKQHDFTHYSNMDFVKAFIAEGCGRGLKDESRPLKVEESTCHSFNQVPFLFGGSSLASFVALFCKGSIQFDNESPVRLVSVGRKYDSPSTVTEQTHSLFNTIQSTCVSAFVVYPAEMQEELAVNEIAMLITQIYTELGLHFKLVQYGAPMLRPEESLAIGICMYSPYMKSDIEVGRISLYQDFISKRLQIYQNLGKKRVTFAGMLYVEILNASKWIGCMIENTQTHENNYKIPDCVQPFMC